MATYYTLKVQGRLWDGRQAEYSYAMCESDARDVTGATDVKRFAGDFESVTGFRLVCEKRTLTETTMVEENFDND